jgi:hypothetical protein
MSKKVAYVTGGMGGIGKCLQGEQTVNIKGLEF